MQATAEHKTRANADTGTDAPDALVFLESEHRAVEKLFDAFKRAKDDDLDAKSTLVQRACEELSIHTILEEELLYPAAQRALPGSDKLDVEEAYIEHFLVKTLIAKFESMKAGDKGFDATFKVMSEMVGHHVEEEEEELFPELRKTKLDLHELGAKMVTRKAELQRKLDAVGSRSVGDNTARL